MVCMLKSHSFDKPPDTTRFSSWLCTVAVYYVVVTRLLLLLFTGFNAFAAGLFSFFLRLASATFTPKMLP